MDLDTRLQTFLLATPVIPASTFVANTATVLGAVTLGEKVSIWFGAVLRGDINAIIVGDESNVQDNAVLHNADDHPCIIGRRVTIGHSAIIHACTVEDEVLVGMAATILDGAVIGARSIVGAGALVTGKSIIPPGSLVLGSPAKVVKTLTEKEQGEIREWADKYVAVSRYYLKHAISGKNFSKI